MLIEYLGFYLIFVIVVSLLVTFVILKLNFPAPQVVIPIVIAVVLLPAPIGYFYVSYFNSIPEVVVPDLSGLPLDAALEKLEAYGLRGKHSGSTYDMEHPEGSVVSERPEAGRRVKAGRVVNLLTSSGKRKAAVPNLLGRPAIQAEAVLVAKGLVLGEVSKDFAPELDPDIILTQTPLPGEEMDVGSYVNITVSASVEAEISRPATEENKGEPPKQGGFKLW